MVASCRLRHFATGHAKASFTFSLARDGGDIAQQAATIVCHHGRPASLRSSFLPDRVNDTLRVIAAQPADRKAQSAGERKSPPLGDENRQSVARNRADSSRRCRCIRPPTPSTTTRPLSFCCDSAALQVFCRSCFSAAASCSSALGLLNCACRKLTIWLRPDISAANGRQQLIQLH